MSARKSAGPGGTCLDAVMGFVEDMILIIDFIIILFLIYLIILIYFVFGKE